MDTLSPTSPVELLRQKVLQSSDTSLPKYQIVRSKLLDLIENGIWDVGDKLPTEADLAHHLPFSLGTIQKAYSMLSEEGVIGRRRGFGSFVRQQNQMAGPMHCRFEGDDGEVLPIYPLVRSVFRFNAKKDLSDAFNGEEDILRIDREISVNNEFVLWNRFYVPARRAQPLLDLPKEQLGYANFKTILGAEPRSKVQTIKQKVWPGVPKLHTAAELDVIEATSFTIEARALGRDGALIYLLEMLVPDTGRALLSTITP